MSAVTQLKRIKFKEDGTGKLKFVEPEFTANGKKYIWYDTVSFHRLEHYKELTLRLSLGKSLPEIYDDFRGIYEAANRSEFANVCVIAYNAMKGIREIDDEVRIPIAFEMVSMFLNQEGEDIRYVDQEMIRKKYEDITEEGFDPQDFFSLAIAFMPEFIRVYEEVTRGTLLKGKTSVKGVSE